MLIGIGPALSEKQAVSFREFCTPEARFPRTPLLGSPVNRGNLSTDFVEIVHLHHAHAPACRHAPTFLSVAGLLSPALPRRRRLTHEPTTDACDCRRHPTSAIGPV